MSTAVAQQTDASCTAEADFAIVLDASGSMSNDDWTKQQSFANSFVSKLKLGADAARVAVLQFSSQYSVELSLSASSFSIKTQSTRHKKRVGQIPQAG